MPDIETGDPLNLGDETHRLEMMLRQAGFQERKPTYSSPSLTEIDIWVDPETVLSLTYIMKQAGLTPFRPRRHAGHRFFIELTTSGWLKVDAKLTGPEPGSSVPKDALWLLTRQRGLVVALLGADGAGKSTAVTCLENQMPVDVVSRYLGGVRRSGGAGGASNVPTVSRPTWRSFAGFPKWLTRTVRQVWSVELAARKGSVVVCDRHPLEAGRLGDEPALIKALKRLAVRTLTPSPDLIMLLHAPGEILYERKGEHSPQHLDRITASWTELVTRRHGVLIDVNRPPNEVCLDIQRETWVRLLEKRRS
ncbi:MAG: hypothetical protein OEY55_03295 [Acidimicrobiia bacterium]|nr:hypothetical protein [Acidimicrobiia bacterium]MDH5504814.1 hypothetical protein [Acidimicrobiia bacterium]